MRGEGMMGLLRDLHTGIIERHSFLRMIRLRIGVNECHGLRGLSLQVVGGWRRIRVDSCGDRIDDE